jgi:circadian clock protein KaiB
MPTDKSSSVEKYHFVLYVDSSRSKSLLVAKKLQRICHSRLGDSYTLDIIDLQDDPDQFEQFRIIAVPALDIKTPEGQTHRFVGDMTQSEIFIFAISLMQEAHKMSKGAQEMRNNIKPLN